MTDRTIEIVIRGKNLSGESFEQVKTDLGEVGHAVEKTSTAMDYALGQIAYDAVIRISDAIGNFASEAVNAAQTYAQQVEDIARQTGTTVEEGSRLIQVADDMRVSVSDLSSALRIYSTKQKEAGASAQISTDLLAKLSDQYLALEPGIQRTNFLIDNFGRGGLAMAKLLEQGSEKMREMNAAVSDNLILTKESIAVSEGYRLTIDELQDSWSGFKNQIGLSLMENETFMEQIDKLTTILDVFAKWFEVQPEKTQTVIADFIILGAVIGKLLPLLVGLKLLLGGLGGAGVAGAAGALAAKLSFLTAFIHGNLLIALGAATKGLIALGTAMTTTALGPIVLLAAAIAGLVLAIILLGPEAKKTFLMIADIIAASLKRAGFELKRFAKEIANWSAQLLNSIGGWFKRVGRGIVDGIWNGIQEGWEWLKTQIRNAIDDLLETFDLKLEMGSPSKVFMERGRMAAAGFALGFDQALSRMAAPAMAGAAASGGFGGGTSNRYSVGTIQVNNPLTQGERNWIRRNQERTVERTLERILK
jgi:predicted DNA-binding ribbon-helix-helix protein